jgi:hypothetical protein
MAQHTTKLQDQILKDMIASARGVPQKGAKGAVRGLINPSRGVGPRILDFIHPPGGDAGIPQWHRTALEVWKAGARLADRALA